jgi:ATP synthase protein I
MQAAVALFFAVVLLVSKGWIEAASAALGGACAVIPALLYASRMLVTGGNDPKRLLRAQYGAEGLKMVATLILFGATFRWFKDVAVLWMFLTYCAALASYFAALLIDG